MKMHHRNMAYRPPREARAEGGSFLIYRHFFRQYVLPHRRWVGLCILLVSLNACSIYLMSYYGRVVIDRILVVSPAEATITSVSAEAAVGSIAARDRAPAAQARPARGGLTEREQAIQASPRPPGAMAMLMGIFALFVLTAVLLNVAARSSQRARIRVSQSIIGRLREDLHRKILLLSRLYHQAQTPGRLMARIVSDVDVVQRQMMATILDASSQLLMFLVGALLLLTLDWRMALIVLVAVIPYAWLYRRFCLRVKPLHIEYRHTNACLYGYVSQKLDAIRAILAYVREQHERLNFHRLFACLIRDSLVYQRYSAVLSLSATAITTTATVAIFIYGVQRVLDGSMSLGKMMYAYGVAASLFGPVHGLTQMSVMITDLLVVLHRLIQILEEPIQVAESPDAVEFPESLKTGLVVQRVHFSYTPEAEPVLRDVTLTIEAGKWVCLMGPSGCGKTTLLQLLARLYDPSSGEILAEGTPLSKFKFSSLRRHMVMVPQEAQIFSGTIRDNITYGDPTADSNSIMAAARAAECHDFIMELPVKYETTIGEKGTSLSGGQRQRVSLARALLTDPEVLLLDDCTSSLDADTERKIQETLSRLMAGKTAIVVTQRVSMAMRCHKICVLNSGIISEMGTHNELLAQKGFYARLYAEQTK